MVATAALLLFATLPPIAVWSTGGLATIPFALAVFCAFERLLGDPARPRGVQAGLFMLLASLIRADGPGFVALIFGTAALTWLLRRSPGLLKESSKALSIFVCGYLWAGCSTLWQEFQAKRRWQLAASKVEVEAVS